MKIRLGTSGLSFDFDAPPAGGPLLPRVPGMRIPGGFRQRHAPESRVLVAFAGLGFLGLVLSYTNSIRIESAHARDATELFMTGLFAICLAFIAYKKFLAVDQKRWGASQFGSTFFDVRPWPLRLGEQFEIELLLRRRALAGADHLTARILCSEKSVEPDQEGFTAVVCRTIELDEVALNPTERQRVKWKAQIPRNDPASLVLPSASIEWMFVVNVFNERGVSIEQRFPLIVVPQVTP